MFGLTATITFGPAPVNAQKMATSTPPSIEELIEESSEKYAVDSSIVYNVLNCESRLKSDAEGDIDMGGTATTSWGIAQIHLPDNPNVTKEQALSPAFSIDFLAKKLGKGQGHLWTCYRNLGYN